ncbi:hypothetical protein H6P81_000936 [Aristolochia fimbriata]|uniref:Uncharacterized protein n=1 Tax=Aristolochia fimbriata TaxID=158543 RepID=A0AAV7F5T0_ARIFI|nr:hypothetical protein H6P81_000936 [Aristolochia fimbriata]
MEEKGMTKMNFAFSQRASLQLLQNCDLPPPIKVFAEEKETFAKSSTQLQFSPSSKGSRVEALDQPEDKLGLLKALNLSQTRAREAEKKASNLRDEKDRFTTLFWMEASQLRAHRHWVKLLEYEITQLRSQLVLSQKEKPREERRDGEEVTPQGWAIALLLVANFGLAIGCSYFFL